MNKQVELEKLFTRFILVCLTSEIIAQRLITGDLVMSEIVHNATQILKSPIDLLYKDIIENFTDLQLDKFANDEMEFQDISTPEDWSDMVTDLVKEIKENHYENK